MPTSALPVIRDLPLLRWRGNKLHCESAPLEGAHDQAERRVPYRDAAGHDHTGRAPYKMRVKLWFLDSMSLEGGLGGFDDLPAFFETLEDGTSGDLVHPLRGQMRARVLDWSVDLSTQNLGGVSIMVTFTETVDDYDSQTALGTLDIDPRSAAEAADAACEEFDIDYPDGQSDSSIGEALGAIEGGITSAGMTIGGKINQVTGAVTNMVGKVESLNDPLAWPAFDGLMLAYASLKDLGKKIDKTSARPMASKRTQNATSMDALAAELGNTTEELMGLNLNLLRSPRIPAGSIVKYYSAK